MSSTNRWVVAEGLRDFGIPDERILAAEVRVTDGVITSEIVDVPTDEAKATALQRVGLPHPDAVFGNSIHDLAMLETGALCLPGQSFSGAAGSGGKEGLGLLQAQGCRRRRRRRAWVNTVSKSIIAHVNPPSDGTRICRIAFDLQGLH